MINNSSYIKRFEANLKIYNKDNDTNYTFEDVQNKFIYVRELRKIEDNDNKHEIECMCGHEIINNYKIINPDTNDSMILGSSCISTYMINTMQICDKCNIRYKFNPNSKNRCRNCKKVNAKCKRCNKIKKVRKSKKKYFINCKKCKKDLERLERIEFENKNKCMICSKKIDGEKYKFCYKHYQEKLKLKEKLKLINNI